VHDTRILELVPVIVEFQTAHAAEIDAARKGWDRIVDEAAALGYHGQRGPLGS
jgi:hypothetical protein